jgi:hypothetical protein
MIYVTAPAVTPNPWLVARNHVSGITPLRQLDPYRQVNRQGYFDTYLNCSDDAFRTAAATLERIQRTGAAAEWIASQDMVFSNCSQGATIPQPTSDPRLRADRAYQIASAKFYSEQYDAARCLLRAGKFAEAETELRSIAANPALMRWHAPASRLLNYVEAHLRPADRMHELALALVRPDSEATIGQDLIDYRMLFDKDVKPQPNDRRLLASRLRPAAPSLPRHRLGREDALLVQVSPALSSSLRNDFAHRRLQTLRRQTACGGPRFHRPAR